MESSIEKPPGDEPIKSDSGQQELQKQTNFEARRNSELEKRTMTPQSPSSAKKQQSSDKKLNFKWKSHEKNITNVFTHLLR